MANAPDVRAVGTGLGSGNSGTPTLPTHDVNDIIVVVAMSANEAFPSMPAGWELAPNMPDGVGTAGAAGGVRLHVFWTRASSSSQTNPAFGDSGNINYLRAMSIANCITTGSPWNVTSNNNNSANNTSLSFPAVTTTEANTLVVLAAAFDRDAASTTLMGNATNANLADITEQMDQIVNTNTGGGVGCLTARKATAGDTGTTSLTLSGASFWNSWTGALLPIPDPVTLIIPTQFVWT